MASDHFIHPSRELFEAFKALPRDEPVQMLNMIRFRAQADYPQDHDNAKRALTGAQAYQCYGQASGPIFQRVGGQIIWRGPVQTMVIGPSEEQWHVVFVARYPSASAFLEMVADAEYQKAVIHRTAAVETSRLIRCQEVDSQSGTFG